MPPTATAMMYKTLESEKVTEMAVENPNVSVEKTILFMKQLSSVAISSIAFLRDIFPPEAFANRKLAGQPVQILQGNENIPGTQTLIKWIKSAFDLVHTHHLKKMILVIKKELTTLEVYTFSFSYDHEEIHCEVMKEADGEEVVLEQRQKLPDRNLPEDIAKSVRQLLRSILAHVTRLDPLPNGCEVSLKLNLDENTPQDMLPECFQPSNASEDFNFPPEAETLKLGKVQTKFTTLGVSTKTIMDGIYSYDESNQNETMASQEDEEDVPSSQIQHFEAMSISSDKSAVDRSMFRENKALENDSNTTNISEKLSIVNFKEQTIRCVCECSDLLNDTIKCDSCSTLQHKVCYKMLESNPVDCHVCVNCHNPNQQRFCSVPELVNDPNMKESALFRQALVYCCNSLQVSCNKIMTHLKIPRKMADKIMLKLDQEGCLELKTHKGDARNVKPNFEQTILPRHFNSAPPADNLHNMDVEHSPGIAPVEANRKKRRHLYSEEKENYQTEKTCPQPQPKRRKILATTQNLKKFSNM